MKSTGYQSGFGNEFATEAVAGALPVGRNSPQRVAHGLYAEQLSRHRVHRAAPREPPQLAVPHPPGGDARRPSRRCAQSRFHNDFDERPGDAGPAALEPAADAGGADRFHRRPVHHGRQRSPGRAASASASTCTPPTASMQGRFFYDADGELLIVPQQGRLHIATELGVLEVEPQEIAVIPRGVRFRVELPDGDARGYVCENFGALLRLPDLGPIGSNGLANRARLPDAERGLRRRRRRVRTDRQVPGPPVARADRPFAARRGRLARQLRAVQVRPAPLQHDRLDQLRPSRSVDLHRAAPRPATRPAPPTWTS